MSKQKKRMIKKFKISSGSYLLMGLLFLVCGIAYGFICYHINSTSSNPDIVLLTFKDVLLVFLSILGTNLLVAAIIEVNSKNKYINDFFTKDIVSWSGFYENIDRDERIKMLSALELLDTCHENEKLKEMHESIKSKMGRHLNDDYYFERITYSITVYEEEDCFRKKTTKTMHVKSYDKHCTVKNYNLATIVCNDIPNCLKEDLIKVTIGNNKKYDCSSIEILPNSNTGGIQQKNGYQKTVDLNLIPDVKLSNNQEVVICLSYELRCNKSDLVSTYRTKHPCKDFSVIYTVEKPSDKYKLVGQAFGFQERANNSTVLDADNVISLGFDDWIFTDDGICITMLEK